MKKPSETYNQVIINTKYPKITKILFLVFILAIFSILARCQDYTTVSGTIVDSDTTTWTNGTWSAQLNNPRGGQVKFLDGTTPVITQFSGNLNSSGAFSQANMPNNAALAPAGTNWTFTFCPDASYQCSILPNISFASGQNTYDISSFATSNISAPRFPALGHQSWGYTDAEVTPIPNVGGVYFNVNESLLRYWNGTAWVSISPGTGDCTGVTGPCVVENPTTDQQINQPSGTTFGIFTNSTTEGEFFMDDFGGMLLASDPGAEIDLGNECGDGCIDLYGKPSAPAATSQSWNIIANTRSNTNIPNAEFSNFEDNGIYITTPSFSWDACNNNPVSSTCTLGTDPSESDGPYTFLTAVSGNLIRTLPTSLPPYGIAGSSYGYSTQITVYKIDSSANTITINPAAGDLIIGYPSGYILSTQWQGVTFSSDGAHEWFVSQSSNINTTSGVCGDATHICQITTNKNGNVTSQNAVTIAGVVTDGSGTTTANQLALSTTTTHQIQYGPAIPNGITATTQLAGDNSTKVATDAFVLANAASATTVDILSNQKPSGTFAYYPGLEYYVPSIGQTVTIFSATGSGYISNIFFASASIVNYQQSILSCKVNGEASPSFTGTLRTLFENAWLDNLFNGNYFLSSNGGMGNSFSMPIPYSNGIVCTVKVPQSSAIWVNITDHRNVTDNWPYTEKLRTSTIEAANPGSSNGVSYTPYSYETLVNYAGPSPGRLVGVWLFDDENAGGAGAALEGNIALYTDTFNATWKASTAFTVGQIILDPNGNFQTVSTAGTTGATEPTFTSATVSGQTTTDGTVTWTASVGTPLNIWRATQPYILNMSFLDPNGNVQTVTTAGTTGATQPTYCVTAGCTTTDGTVVTTTSLASTMVQAVLVATGTEDFFGLGFYGDNTTTNDQGNNGTNGMTWNSLHRYGFYRFFVNDPIRFNNSIGIIRQIGDPSEASLTNNTLQMAATYFYTQDTN